VKIWNKILGSKSLPSSDGTFIVEPVDSNISIHQVSIYSHIISRAKNLTPVFLTDIDNDLRLKKLLSRYFDHGSFKIKHRPKLLVINKVYLFITSCYLWLLSRRKKKIIELKYKGMFVGDIVYDQYLAAHSRGTIDCFDIRLAKIIYQIISAIEVSRKVLNDNKPKAILLSHMVGLSSAPLSLVSEEMGAPIYKFAGQCYGTLLCSNKRKKYFYIANSDELKPLLNLPKNVFDNLFEKISDQTFSGKFNRDSKLAFSNSIITNRTQFYEKYNLDAKKKNVFIMLHAFNDYPHSHFNGMLFDDFLDWFLKTLEYASKNQSVNWIIKEHPSSKFYPVEDVDWAKLKMKYSSKNIIFLSVSSDFNSKSIGLCGDAIITCNGTAGYEFSALYGIPSITAGDNSYAESGFAIYPRTREDYFKVLDKVESLGLLSEEEQKKAKATFLYIHRFSRVPLSANLNLTQAEHKSLQYDDNFFDMIDDNAVENEELIKVQLKTYIELVAKSNFQALRTDVNKYLKLED